MITSTLYRVSLDSFFVTELAADGAPVRWSDRRGAGQFPRPAAESIAQRLADYLTHYPTAGPLVARRVRVAPARGGYTDWRPVILYRG